MNNELISVIVPIYNVDKYLEKCLDSIINQTYKKIEIILVDDGSTDNCGDICDRYKINDDRIIVIHKNNEGLSSARNKGIDVAKGELIAFVDSDDFLEYDMLEKLNENLNLFNSDLSICNYFYIKGKRSNVRINENFKYCFDVANKNKFLNLHNKYGKITVVSWNKLYKKKLFDGVRYPNGKIYEDDYIICDLLDKAERVSYTLTPLYNHVYRKNSIFNSFDISHFDRIEAFNKKISFFNNKKYYDLVLKEEKCKIDSIISNLSKMKRYKIKNKEVFNKYYKELLDTNKEVKWKDANKKVKLFKIFRRPSISILAIMYRVRDFIRR